MSIFGDEKKAKDMEFFLQALAADNKHTYGSLDFNRDNTIIRNSRPDNSPG
jgi:hypothetical protein